MSAKELAKRAKESSRLLVSQGENNRVKALKSVASSLVNKITQIENENKKDIEEAKKNNLSESMIDRLLLSEERIRSMAEGVLNIAMQENVVGEIVSESKRDDGLIIKKERVPIGVIAMVFESRPNVVIDTSCLAIKSANSILLKGGKEAKYSNRILANIVRESIKEFLPIDSVQLIESREDVSELLSLNQYVDLIIPRGGKNLIQYVYNNAKMPVIAHFEGLCHGYVQSDANLSKAKEVCLNAKAQRTGVCNAMETLLLDEKLPTAFVTDLFKSYTELGIELRLDSTLFKQYSQYKEANDLDWSTEYLDKILSIKQVSGLDSAIEHIQKYGSHHTEFICSEDPESQNKFRERIDASCIMINASSRFNDGGELGLGAELGISTSKIHAYGPMGAREMTSIRYLVIGNGHIRK